MIGRAFVRGAFVAGSAFFIASLPTPSVQAATLIADDFDGLTSGVTINGRAPVTNVINSSTWVAPTDDLLADGAGGIAANSTINRSATLDLGAGFLVNNPGVYSLSANITQPTLTNPGNSWIGLGFTQSGLASNNFVANVGAPWMLFRLTGATNYYGGPGVTDQRTNTTGTGDVTATQTRDTAHLFRLDLDTTGTQWTLNAYVDGVQVDLNGTAAAGSTYTYAAGSNPTSSRYVAFGTGISGTGGTGTVDNFSLTGPVPAPEPGAAGLIIAAGAFTAGARRRRSRA